MAVTPISELREYAEGMEVELPGFVEEKPIVVKLRRPSMLLLAQEGVIPNPLLSAASELFRSGKTGEKAGIKDMGEIFRVIARAALVSPSYDELEEAGLVEQVEGRFRPTDRGWLCGNELYGRLYDLAP